MHSEAGQPSRVAWQTLIRSAMIARPGRDVWWLAQHKQCKWLVVAVCWGQLLSAFRSQKWGEICVNWIGMGFWGWFPSNTCFCAVLSHNCMFAVTFSSHRCAIALCTPCFCWSLCLHHIPLGLSLFSCSQPTTPNFISITSELFFSLSGWSLMAEMLADEWVYGENSPHATLCCRKPMGREAGGTTLVQQPVDGEDACRDLQWRPRTTFCYQLRLC